MPAPAAVTPVTPRRILVIDDSALVRAAASFALGSLGGHEVLTAESAEEGLICAADERPDAIVLDVVMPGMGGIAAALQLAGDPATTGIPIVLRTARADDGDREDYARLPVSGVVGKPFELSELAGELATMFGWSR
jgi:two-component system alkaline phosphatase synthesis response regulator PhoP